MKFLLCNVVALLSLFACVVCGQSQSKEPIVVTDSNWTQILEGEWMLEFMAPWCPACRAFQDAWSEFAGWGKDLDISVGVVDVTQNPGLSGRFLVTSLPTIYHIKEGVFRQYLGGRKTSDLISVIDEKKWESQSPVSWYRDPSSMQMGVVGAFFKTAMFIRGIYNTMTDVYGIPEWACYVIFAILTIITGLLLGLLLVVCCDNFFPAKYIPLPPQQLVVKDLPKDDTDIIDDTNDDLSPDQVSQDGSGEGARSDEKDVDDSPQESSDLRKRVPRTET